jgi:hypothetical protein
MLTTNVNPECDACLFEKIHKPATTKSTNPRYVGWELCEECAEDLNKRKHTHEREIILNQDNNGSFAE